MGQEVVVMVGGGGGGGGNRKNVVSNYTTTTPLVPLPISIKGYNRGKRGVEGGKTGAVVTVGTQVVAGGGGVLGE